MIYPTYKRPIRYINNNPYLIFAEISIERVDRVNANDVKSWLGCDTAFRVSRNGIYMFCDLIKEVEWEYVKED